MQPIFYQYLADSRSNCAAVEILANFNLISGILNCGIWDYQARTLTVEIHRCGSALQDAALARLCETLTATETCFPTTDLRLIYSQVGSP